MKIISRTEQVIQDNHYILPITEKLITSIKETYKYLTNQDFDFTEEMVESAATGNMSYDFDQNHPGFTPVNTTYGYEITPFYWLEDYINDLVWDSFEESVNVDTTDFSTEVIDDPAYDQLYK